MEPAIDVSSTATVASLHAKALTAEKAKREQQALESQILNQGTLGSQSAGDSVPASDAGLSSFVVKSRTKKKDQSYRGLSATDIESESDRSKRAIAAHFARADSVLQDLRKSLEFSANYDDFETTAELKSLSLEQYLARSRQRFHAQRNKTIFNSNLETAERKQLFEHDVDTMKPEDANLPLPPTEEEIERLGRELGLLKPSGGWKSRCDCDKKLEHIKQHVKLHERKLTKIKMMSAFLNQLDGMMLAVDKYRTDIVDIEDERLKDVLEAKQNHFALLTTVQNQKQQLDRLKRRVKDVSEAKAIDEEEKEAEKQLASMREYLSNQSKNLGQRTGGVAGGIAKNQHKQRMRKVLHYCATHEKHLMGALDFDGHEDKQMSAFLEMQRSKKAGKDAHVQTMSDSEYFDTFGVYPNGAIGFAKKAAAQSVYSIQSTAASAGSAITPGAIAEMRRLAMPTPSPQVVVDPESAWTSETRLIESAVQQLAKQVTSAFEGVEAQRSRVMTTVVQVCKDNDSAMEELNPLFAHAANCVRDASQKITDEVRLAMKRISLAAKDAVSRSAAEMRRDMQREMIAMAGSGSGAGAESSAKQSFSEYVAATQKTATGKAQGAKEAASGSAKKPVATSGKASPTPAAKSGAKDDSPAKTGKKSTSAAQGASTAKGASKKKTGQEVTTIAAQDDEDATHDIPPLGDDSAFAAQQFTAPSPLPSEHQPIDFGQMVHRSVLEAAIAQLSSEASHRFNALRKVIVRVAERLSQCAVLDFGRASVVDLELASTPDEFIERATEVGAYVDVVIGQREPFVQPQLATELTALRNATVKFVGSLRITGYAFSADANEYFNSPITWGERTPSGALSADLANWKGHMNTVAAKCKDAVRKLCDADRQPLEDLCCDVIGALQQFSEVAGACTSDVLHRLPMEYLQGSAPTESEMELPLIAALRGLPLTTRPDLETSMRKVERGLMAQADYFDSFKSMALHGIVEMSADLEECRESMAALRARLLIYEPEEADEGEDPWAGMTAFERKAVQERDRLADELECREEKMRELERSLGDRKKESDRVLWELELTRREMKNATEAQQVQLRDKQLQLISKALHSLKEHEATDRMIIQESHAVMFVPIASAFAAAFKAAARPIPTHVSTQTPAVHTADFEADTTDLTPATEEAAAGTEVAVVACRSTAVTPVHVVSESCGLSRRASVCDVGLGRSRPPSNHPTPHFTPSDAEIVVGAAPCGGEDTADFGSDQRSAGRSIGVQAFRSLQIGDSVDIITDVLPRDDAHVDTREPLVPLTQNGGLTPSRLADQASDGASTALPGSVPSCAVPISIVTSEAPPQIPRLHNALRPKSQSPPPSQSAGLVTRVDAAVEVRDASVQVDPPPPSESSTVVVTKRRTGLAKPSQLSTAHEGADQFVLHRDQAQQDEETQQLVSVGVWVWPDCVSCAVQTLPSGEGFTATLASSPAAGMASIGVACSASFEKTSPAIVMTSRSTMTSAGAVEVIKQSTLKGRGSLAALPSNPVDAAAAIVPIPRAEPATLVITASSVTQPPAVALPIPDMLVSAVEPIVTAISRATNTLPASELLTLADLARYLTSDVAPLIEGAVQQQQARGQRATPKPCTPGGAQTPSAHPSGVPTEGLRSREGDIRTLATPSMESAMRSAGSSRKSKRVTIDEPITAIGNTPVNSGAQPPTLDAVKAPQSSGDTSRGETPTVAGDDAGLAGRLAGNFERLVTPADTSRGEDQSDFPMVRPSGLGHRRGANEASAHASAPPPLRHHQQPPTAESSAATLPQPSGIPIQQPAVVAAASKPLATDAVSQQMLMRPSSVAQQSSAVVGGSRMREPTGPRHQGEGTQDSVGNAARHDADVHARASSPALLVVSSAAEGDPSRLDEAHATSRINVGMESHLVSAANNVVSGVTTSFASLQPKRVLADTAVGDDVAELVERPTLASSRGLRPNSRGLVDVERLLELHALLMQTLTELFKRLETRSKVTFEDDFGASIEPPQPAAVIGQMHTVLSSVFRLLHSDSRLARRSMTKALVQHALQRRLVEFQRRKHEMALVSPQAAAFLDRQEEKMRLAVSRLESVRQQIAVERVAMLREFFLPVSDVPVTHIMAGMMSRRRTHMAPNPASPVQGVVAGSLVKGHAPLTALGPAHIKGPDALPPLSHSPVLARAQTLLDTSVVARVTQTPPPCTSERIAGADGASRMASKTPLPDMMDPRWLVRPAPRRMGGAAAALGSLRAPAARHIVARPGRAAAGVDSSRITAELIMPLQGTATSLHARRGE